LDIGDIYRSQLNSFFPEFRPFDGLEGLEIASTTMSRVCKKEKNRKDKLTSSQISSGGFTFRIDSGNIGLIAKPNT
jgi:hypothetical protein